MKKQHTIPTIIGVLFLLVGVGVGVFLVSTRIRFIPSASSEEVPRDVRITNVTDRSFTVSWITSKRISGYVLYGDKKSLGFTAGDSVLGNTHWVKVENTEAAKTYYFKIGLGTEELYEVKTAPLERKTMAADLVYGKVVKSAGIAKAGNEVGRAIVYVSFPAANALSTLSDSEGRWVIDLAKIRTQSGLPVNYNKQTSLEILVQTATAVSSAKISVAGARPVPDMALGQNYSFTNVSSGEDRSVPYSSIQLAAFPQVGTSPVLPTSTPAPGIKPTPTFAPTPTPTPTLKPLPTKSAVKLTPTGLLSTPTAGDLTPSVVTFIMGLLFLSVGFLLPKLTA